MSNGFRCRAATRKCCSGHETAARIDAAKHAIHQPYAHQVASDRARKAEREQGISEITCFAQCALQHGPERRNKAGSIMARPSMPSAPAAAMAALTAR